MRGAAVPFEDGMHSAYKNARMVRDFALFSVYLYQGADILQLPVYTADEILSQFSLNPVKVSSPIRLTLMLLITFKIKNLFLHIN